MARERTARRNREMRSSVAPIGPRSGMVRATRQERYSREPSSRALTTGRKLCPSRKVQLLMATSAWLVANAPAPAPACRKVTTDSRLTTPARWWRLPGPASRRSPLRSPSCCRRTTAYKTTAVPTQARATITSRMAPIKMGVSGPGLGRSSDRSTLVRRARGSESRQRGSGRSHPRNECGLPQ